MKKKFFATAMLFLCISAFAFAQVEKGNWIFGGSSNLEFDATKEKVKSGSTTSDGSKYSDFDFRPQVGYFVIDKLPVGLFMDLSLDKMKDENYDSEYKWTSFLIGPFVRYYITDLDGFMPYAEAGLGIGSGNNKTTYSGNESDEKYNMFGYKFGAGGTYFVTKNVGVDLFIGYKLEQETYKNEDTGERSDVVTYKCGGLSLNIGFIISLGK
ncbi:MAG: hypothetical protein CVU14_04665 [Bacteroidetes bacterium HGW-Bacteroidetes-9]|jgi:outer membrane protein|nr:MAG: hypothetical protein CVU14_04665 [Bacteroidetes bacterium HGW-Bacteroidetes-9]